MDQIHIGVDIGGTTLSAGIVTPAGRLLSKITAPTLPEPGRSERILETIVTSIRSLLDREGIPLDWLRSIGLGFPGTVDSRRGTVVFAPNIFFENVAVTARLTSLFGCPVYLGQDSRAAAWGEYRAGSGRTCRDLAVITLGTGIGCGLILNGRLFHGGYNTAGEFGHQLIDPAGPLCNCGRRGCLETYCAGLAIVRAGQTLGQKMTVKEVYALAEAGHPAAREITDQVVRYLGRGLVNLINLLSVQRIALSGGIAKAPDSLLLEPVRRFVETHAYAPVARKVDIVRASLGEDAPLIGAALLDETTGWEGEPDRPERSSSVKPALL